MTKLVSFLLVVAFASVLVTIEAASCVDRNVKDHNATESTVDKLSNFFMEVGCTLKSGAEKVKERVESGYNYLKSKIDESTHSNNTTQDTKPKDNVHDLNVEPKKVDVPKAAVENKVLDEDRITFKDSDETENAPQEVTTVEIETTTVAVDNRVAISAPEMCKEGEEMIDGKCRETANFWKIIAIIAILNCNASLMIVRKQW